MEQGALKNFYEVFINYPSTQWAPKAGGYARRTKEILESLGAKPNITITDEQWNKVATLQFQEARSLLSQQQYEKALESYTTVINVFPESEMSIDAIGEMVRCHIELCTDSNSAATAAIYAPMFAGYLAERFCMNSNLATKAGDQIVRIAEFFGERGNKDAQDVLYAKFFTLYSKHSRAPSIQYRFGDNQLRRENYAEALNYFKQVADNYPDLPLGLDALFRVAYCYGKMDDTTNEIASLEAFVAGLEKQDKGNSFLMVEARNRIAYANWKSGKATHLVALKQFNDLIVALDQPNPRFVHGDEDKKRGQEILESAMFFKASGFASLAEPAERIKDFRTAAFAGFTDLLKRFPKSSFAPRALGQMAALFIADGQADKATDAIRQLERDYPDSTEAKNSTFMMAKALLDMGFKEQAIKYFRKMFEGGGAFTESQIVSAATELMKSKEYEIALNGFERVLAGVSTNRSLLELSLLGKGKCLTELGRYQDAVTALVSFTNAYPRTANLIDASLYIGRAYSEVAASEPDRQKRIRTFNLGVKALKEGMKYERSQSGRARMTYEAGRIQERQAEGELKSGTKEQAKAYQGQAVATYRTLSLTYSPAEPGVAEWMQKADAQSVPLLMTLGMEKDAYEVCETHLKRFAGSSQAQQMRRLRNQLAATLAGRGELPSSAGVIEDVGSTNALATTNIASAVVNAASNATNVAGAVTNAPAPTAN
jgi:TolA-binding protein